MKLFPIALLAALPAVIHAVGDEACETEERLCISSEIFLIDGEDAVPLPDNTVAITASDNSTVTFSITQNWLSTGSIDYISPVFDSGGRAMVCDEANKMMTVAPGYSQTFTAECDQWGKAAIELFVRGQTFEGVSRETNYRGCLDWWGANKIATYKLELSCDTTPVCGPDYEAELVAEQESAEEEESGYKCRVPQNTRRYSVITRGDAWISASNIYSGVAIGGTLSNPLGNQQIIGSKWPRMSYVFRLVGKCMMDFKGYRKVGTYLQTVIDFGHFEYLVKNAESRKIGGRTNVLMVGT
jgi:hypothetical protein